MTEKQPTDRRQSKQKRALTYTIDLEPGNHSYVFAEGVGECRAHFAKLVEDLDKGIADVVMAAEAKLFFIDTSPMWMEKFVATVKRRGVLVVDAMNKKEYDLRKPEEEAAFRAVKKH